MNKSFRGLGSSLVLGGALSVALVAGCGNNTTCGAGTKEVNGACVPSAQPVICGDGTVLKNGECDVPPAQPPTPAIDVKVTQLVLDHDDKTPLYLYHPMKVKVGLAGTGLKSLVSLHFSLVPTTPAAGANTVTGCAIGGADVILTGSGDEQVFDYSFFLPKHCPMGTYNVEVGFDSTGGAPPLANNVVVFSAANAQLATNSACKGKSLAGDARDCAYNLTLNPSPGVDFQLAAFVPQSTIGVQYLSDPAQPPDANGNPVKPFPQPFNRGNYTVNTLGLDIEDPNGMAATKGLSIGFQIRAVKDKANDGWKDLFFGGELVDPTCTMSCAKYNPTVHPLDQFRPGLDFQAASNMYLTGLNPDQTTNRGALDLILTGNWATEEDFYVKACLTSTSTQAGDPVYGGSDGKNNDCQTIQMRIVRAQPPAASASSLAFNKDYTKSIGKDDLLSFTGTIELVNAIDLQGAHLNTTIDAHLTSNKTLNSAFGGPTLNLLNGTAKAEAFVSLLGSHIDAGLTVYKYNLLTFTKVFPDTFTWTLPTMMFSKSYSTTFKYYAVPLVGVDVSFGATGMAMVDAGLTVMTKMGSDASDPVFANATSVGDITGKVTTTGSIAANASVSVTLLSKYKLDANANFKLLDLNAPLIATLNWGLTNASPLTLAVDGKANFNITLVPLQGSVDVNLSYASSCWIGCPKAGAYNIFTVAPTSFNQLLLNVSNPPVILGGK